MASSQVRFTELSEKPQEVVYLHRHHPDVDITEFCRPLGISEAYVQRTTTRYGDVDIPEDTRSAIRERILQKLERAHETGSVPIGQTELLRDALR